MNIQEKAKNIQNDLKENAQKIWFAGLGALVMAGEEGSKVFKTLVEKGESLDTGKTIPVQKVKEGLDSAKGRAEDLITKLENLVQDKVGLALQKMGVPTREEVAQLTERVDALMAALEKRNTSKSKEA